MINPINIIGVIIVISSAFGLFQVKYHVQNLRKDLIELTKHLDQEKESIHVLKAEWAYLTEPKKLREITAEHLNLEAVKVKQMRKLINNLPLELAEIEPEIVERKFAQNPENTNKNPKLLNKNNKSHNIDLVKNRIIKQSKPKLAKIKF
ncbi:MAG: hypothetical protein ACK4OM_00930 [Alphaproteobacteria bacterium]